MAAKEVLSTPPQTITVADFHTFAALIPDKAEDRLPAATVQVFKSLLNRTGIDDTLIDIHCHAFTYKNIPKNFIKYPSWIPHNLVIKAAKLVSKDFGTSLNLSTPMEIVDQLLKIYNTATQNKVKKIVLGILTMDMERAISGGVNQNYEGQLSEIHNLLKNYQFNQENLSFTGSSDVLPFLAIDPHNKDVFRMFLSAFVPNMPLRYPGIETGTFQGIKIYPSLGYVPHHPVLMEIFKVCEAKQIPITSHCGGNRTHPSADKIVVSYRKWHDDGTAEDKTQSFLLKNSNGDRFTKYFNRPEHWQKVLKIHPNLKLNLAHFGSNDDWKHFLSEDVNERAKSSVLQTIHLLESKNVYADFSYSFYSLPHVRAIFNTLSSHPVLKKKIMYGSDYYMCQIEDGGLEDYFANVRRVFGDDPDLNDHFFVKNAIGFLMG
jgi:hypothetical protein